MVSQSVSLGLEAHGTGIKIKDEAAKKTQSSSNS
jgi:hypothetical protein